MFFLPEGMQNAARRSAPGDVGSRKNGSSHTRAVVRWNDTPGTGCRTPTRRPARRALPRDDRTDSVSATSPRGTDKPLSNESISIGPLDTGSESGKLEGLPRSKDRESGT